MRGKHFILPENDVNCLVKAESKDGNLRICGSFFSVEVLDISVGVGWNNAASKKEYSMCREQA